MTKLMPQEPAEEMIENLTWYVTGENRGQPVWRFDHLGHRGDVVFGGDTKYSAKLDNSGRYGIETADEAKTLAVTWLKNRVKANLLQATKWLNQYEAAPTIEQEPVAEVEFHNITNIHKAHKIKLLDGVKIEDGIHKLYLAPPDQSQRIKELEAATKAMKAAISALTKNANELESQLNECVSALEYVKEWCELIRKNNSSMVTDLMYVRARDTIAKVKK